MNKMKIVVDMLGGDLGIAATYSGLEAFIASHPDVEIYAVGTANVLNSLKNVKVIDANQNVKMDAHAMELLHDKESSMAKAFETLNKENADAIVSCGGTGALLTFASIKVKKLDNVLRPALVSPIPTLKEGKKTLLLDLGANNENKVEELVSFAKMAKVYYEAVYGKDPSIALLSNGTEEGKGSPLIQETHKVLKEAKLEGFVGNIESSELLKGNIDIVVTDGFTGNIALKAIEGTGNVVKFLLKDMFKKSLKNKLAYLLVKKDLKKKLTMLSSKPLGGAMFIGLKKVVVKAHGNSDAIAFKNALETAYRSVKGDLVGKISEGASHE
ncbi:MAG: phosphate acyltransferase PlsX [Bacilli bacterium]|nr:phosphate acyltransferase PlsX [Bacilli bacterium]